MRYYTAKPMNDGTAFKWPFCEPSVNTVDFKSTSGNRCQAAAVMNRHAVALHFSCLRRVSGRTSRP